MKNPQIQGDNGQFISLRLPHYSSESEDLPVKPIEIAQQAKTIHPAHRKYWTDRGVLEEIIDLNVKTLGSEKEISAKLNRKWQNGAGWLVSGVDPATGDRIDAGLQFRPNKPLPQRGKDGEIKLDKEGNPKLRKFESPAKIPTSPLFLAMPDPEFWQKILGDSNKPIVVTEGAAKAGCLLSNGLAAISLPGVCNGAKLDRLHEKLQLFCEPGRKVYLAFDADLTTNSNVQRAMRDLGAWVKGEGALPYVVLWDLSHGKGCDDLIVGQGFEAFQQALNSALTFREWLEENPNAGKKKEGEAEEKPSKPEESTAAAIVAKNLKDTLIYADRSKIWFQYGRSRSGVWSAISDEQVLGLIQEQLGSIPGLEDGYRSSYAKGVLTLSRKDLQADSWESVGSLIPFENGVYVLDENRFSPNHSPAFRLTWQLPRRYNPEASDCPHIDAWLHQVFDNERDRVRFEAAAAAVLRNKYQEQIFIHCQGAPRAGKSTALALLKELVGEANAVTTNLQSMNTDKFDTGRYLHKTLILMPDHPDYSGDISVFLQVTGNDSIRIERKNKDAGDMLCNAIIAISSNGSVFKGRTGSELTERQVLFHFDKPVAKEKRDPDFKKKLFKDLEAWTNRLLAIPDEQIHSLLHGLDTDAVFTRDQWNAKLENDSIAGWADECLAIYKPEHDFSVPRAKVGSASDPDTLYGSYFTWCKESGKQSVSRDNFSKHLLTLLGSIFPDLPFAKERKTQGYCITGVALRDSTTDRPFITDLLFPAKVNKGNEPHEPPMNPHYERLEVLEDKGYEQYEPLEPIETNSKEGEENNTPTITPNTSNTPVYKENEQKGSCHSYPLQGNGSSCSPGGFIRGSCSSSADKFKVGDRVWSHPKKAQGVVLVVGDGEARVDFGSTTCWQPLAQLVNVNPEV